MWASAVRLPRPPRVPTRARPVSPAAGILLGAHALDYDLHTAGTSPTSVTIASGAAGSSLLVCAMGDSSTMAAPTDSKGNTLSALRSSNYFGDQWAPYNMRVYGKANMVGGSSHTISATKTGGETNESTLIAIEVAGGTVIQDSSIVARESGGSGVALNSGTVTTTGPALLVSFCSGDGNIIASHVLNAEAGWAVPESIFLAPGTSYIQTAAAVKYVGGPGTYSLQWTPVGDQGAIIFVAAVQA